MSIKPRIGNETLDAVLVQKAVSLKAGLPCIGGGICAAVIDGFLGRIDEPSARRKKQTSGRERRQLRKLVQYCEKGEGDAEHLHRAAMEIGGLAPPADEGSVQALAGLLKHEDRLVRICACKSLGYVGGEHAKQLLQAHFDSKDVELKRAAQEAYCLCGSREVAHYLGAAAVNKAERSRSVGNRPSGEEMVQWNEQKATMKQGGGSIPADVVTPMREWVFPLLFGLAGTVVGSLVLGVPFGTVTIIISTLFALVVVLFLFKEGISTGKRGLLGIGYCAAAFLLIFEVITLLALVTQTLVGRS